MTNKLLYVIWQFMSYITSRKTRLEQQLTRVQTALFSLYDQLADATTSVKSYTFDSGDGKQSTTRRELKDIQETISKLEATEAHLINELSGMGIISLLFRRKRP